MKGRIPRVNCDVNYLYLSSKNIHSFTNRIFNFIFLAMTRHKKEIVLSEINEPIYVITEYALHHIFLMFIQKRKRKIFLIFCTK